MLCSFWSIHPPYKKNFCQMSRMSARKICYLLTAALTFICLKEGKGHEEDRLRSAVLELAARLGSKEAVAKLQQSFPATVPKKFSEMAKFMEEAEVSPFFMSVASAMLKSIQENKDKAEWREKIAPAYAFFGGVEEEVLTKLKAQGPRKMPGCIGGFRRHWEEAGFTDEQSRKIEPFAQWLLMLEMD